MEQEKKDKAAADKKQAAEDKKNQPKKPAGSKQEPVPPTVEQFKAFQKWETERVQSISTEITEGYHKHMMWYTLAVALAVSRAPTDGAVILAYVAILGRIVQVFGWYSQRKVLYMGGCGFEVFCSTILFFYAMAWEP
jgi:hypothetical protein